MPNLAIPAGLFIGALVLYFLKRYYAKKGKGDVYFEVLEKGKFKDRVKISFIYITVFTLCGMLTTLLILILGHFRRTTLPINELFYSDVSLYFVAGTIQLFFFLMLMHFPYYFLEFRLFKGRLNPEQKKQKYKMSAYVSIIVLVITLPFTVLMYDTYDVVTNDQIIIDEFWSLQAKEYNIQDLNKIEMDGAISTQDVVMKVTFFTNSGESFNLWHHWPLPEQQQFKGKKQIETLLYFKEKEIPITFTRPSIEELKTSNTRNKDYAIELFNEFDGYFNH
ncbi:hypothetical protein HOL83_05845 [Candidatus Woesearchaeota archaeon]|jgi:hypothetical protein|nr:hypothetical protein [Candidatus Woesearchaeota archaeon]MBT6040444.1 hypothetical protein [Candidatus Woesearchaeota archaeon]MBT6336923.1 hypothetical protein [Candidatus Woesearchaeota archaeon]